MEMLARKKAESEKDALEQRILELQTEKEQRAEGRASVEPMSQHGSTSHPHVV